MFKVRVHVFGGHWHRKFTLCACKGHPWEGYEKMQHVPVIKTQWHGQREGCLKHANNCLLTVKPSINCCLLLDLSQKKKNLDSFIWEEALASVYMPASSSFTSCGCQELKQCSCAWEKWGGFKAYQLLFKQVHTHSYTHRHICAVHTQKLTLR